MNKMMGWLQCQIFGHVAASCMPQRSKSPSQNHKPMELKCPRCGSSFELEIKSRK